MRDERDRVVRRSIRTPGFLASWAVMAWMLTAPVTGWAATYGTAGITSFPRLHVVGNGQEYTNVTESSYEWKGWVELDAKGFALIEGWHLYPTLRVEGQPSQPLSLYKASDSYPFGKWATYVKKTETESFPGFAVRDFAARACNRNADKLREQGRSNTWIFDREHKIALEVWADYDVNVTVGDKFLEAGWPMLNEIVCEKWAGAAPVAGAKDLQGIMEVRAAQLVLFPGIHTGACPVDISLFMKVKGNGAGSFEAWVESSDGWKSKKMIRSIGGQSGGEYQVDFSEKVPVPIVLPASTPGGGSGAGSQASTGKAAAKGGPGDTLPPKGGPPVAGGGLAAADRPDNVHKASLRLVAVGGGKTVASDWQDYTVTCDPKVTAGLQPADNLATAVSVLQSSLAVTPQAGLSGKCGVELRGQIQTNVANAKVKLAYRNHKGVTTPPREVTTGLNKQAVFTDQLDFSKKQGGMWIEQGGAWNPNGGGHAGEHAGSFQIVGQNIAFQSSPVPYSFKCVNPPPGGLAAAGGPTPVLPQGGAAPGKPDLATGRTTAALSAGRPDLVSKSVAVGGELVSAGAVEVLSASKAKGYRDGRCLFRIEYRVDNEGPAKTPGSFRNVLLWGGTVLDDHVAPGLGPGESRTRVLDAYLTPGEHGLTLRVDADRAAAESDEANNVRTARVRLNGPCASPQVKGATPGAPAAPAQMKTT